MKTKEQYLALIERIIDKHGVFLQHVMAVPSFTYTVGLYPTLGFELVCTGLPPDSAQGILNDLCFSLRAGWVMKTDEIIPCNDEQHPDSPNKWASTAVMFRDTDRELTEDYTTIARVRAGVDDMRVVQLVWPDPAGLFPHQLGYAQEWLARQPLLYKLH